MADIERLTITLPSEMAATVESAVQGGDYASISDVVREALRDWTTKRAQPQRELAALKTDIDKGLADVANGRVQVFDVDRIIQQVGCNALWHCTTSQHPHTRRQYRRTRSDGIGSQRVWCNALWHCTTPAHPHIWRQHRRTR